MLHPHSILWHYLWAGPNVLLIVLASILIRRGFHRSYPVFVAYALVDPVAQLVVYLSDLSPAIAPSTWWKIFWASLLVESVLKFSLFAELYAHSLTGYSSVARLGKHIIRGLGSVLVLTAAVLAAIAPFDSKFGIISGAHLLRQTIYLVESGLLLFLFLFCAYFKLKVSRPVLGICVGIAVSSCLHLAVLAFVSNGGLSVPQKAQLDFVNMAAFHACVLVWFHYLLVPVRAPSTSAASLPDHNLEVWNRELERLLQR